MEGDSVIPLELHQEIDLYQAIDAIDEIMSIDKPSRQEIADWCNKHLALVKRYGRQLFTIEFF